jgi:hypothetical protein
MGEVDGVGLHPVAHFGGVVDAAGYDGERVDLTAAVAQRLGRDAFGCAVGGAGGRDVWFAEDGEGEGEVEDAEKSGGDDGGLRVSKQAEIGEKVADLRDGEQPRGTDPETEDLVPIKATCNAGRNPSAVACGTGRDAVLRFHLSPS